LLQGIQAGAAEAQKRDRIDSTPILLVNGRKIPGAAPYDEFKSVIDEAVAQAR
jgi:predicted DsbA family dithiol-disulfide isomerase